MKHIQSFVTLGRWAEILLTCLFSCDNGPPRMTCEDASPAEGAVVSGVFNVEYDGSLGFAPIDGYKLHVKVESEEAVEIRGCHGGEDYWYIAVEIKVPRDAVCPVAFSMDDTDSAQAAIFLERCSEGNSNNAKRTWYGYPWISPPVFVAKNEGVLTDFGPGILKVDVTLTTLDPRSYETGTVRIIADIRWKSSVVHTDGGASP